MSNNKDSTKDKLEDVELDELLDSALKDLTKVPEKPDEKASTSEKENEIEHLEDNVPAINSNVLMNNIAMNWDKDFLAQTVEQFENLIKDIPPSLLEDLAKTSVNPTTTSEEGTDNVAATISDTIKKITENMENLPNSDQLFNEENLSQLLNTLNLSGEGFDPAAALNNGNLAAGGEGFLLMMQEMMRSLMDKQLIYPSLKNICDKYPEWLNNNQEKLSEADNNRFVEQNKLMKKICEEYENETDSDSKQVKDQRFNKIFEIVIQMQTLGNPPQELVDECGGGSPWAQFEANGMPTMNSAQLEGLAKDQCSII